VDRTTVGLGGLSSHDPSAAMIRTLRHQDGDRSSLPADAVVAIEPAADGSLWIALGESAGLVRIDPERGVLQRYAYRRDAGHGLSSDYLISLARDRDGRLWIGSGDRGLDRLDPATGQVERFGHGGVDGIPGPTVRALLVTRGEHGMTLLRPEHPALHLPARAREVFDVTGAGDTVISTMAAALAAGESLTQAMTLANLAAGIVVGKLGTATISAPELRRALQREDGAERGVLSLQQLQAAVEDAKAQGERVVFTNGCFDILHAGHVSYLEQAREQGDRLIVAVNGDASVTRLKGPGRPINSVDRRMAVLAGLGAVDWVVSFSEDTPESLITLLKPDILVKGGDYGVDQVVGAELVYAYGGEVRVLGLVENSSTTAIVEKIRTQ